MKASQKIGLVIFIGLITGILTLSIASAKAKKPKDYSTKYFDYGAEYVFKKNISNTVLYRIERKTGKKTVVTEKAQIGVPGLDVYESLTLIAQPYSSNFVYFVVTRPESDAGYGALFKYDIKSNTFSKLKLNSIWKGGWNNFALSPDGTRVAYVGQDPNFEEWALNYLYVCDLLSDSCKLLEKLSPAESFDGGQGGLTSLFNISWSGSDFISAESFRLEKTSNEPIKISKGTKLYPIY